jgi:hypothetical protein
MGTAVMAQQYKELPLFHPDLLNPSYIKQNKILLITATVSYKTDKSRIQSKGIEYTYSFNTEGNIEREMQVMALPTGVFDTVRAEYYYSKGLLSIKRVLRGGQYFGYYYEYDSLKRKIKEVETLDIRNKSIPDAFVVEKQKIMALEQYAYTKLTPTQEKVTFLNDESRAYKNGILYTNEKGILTEENYQFNYTALRTNIKYKYDNKGKLTEQVFTSDAGETYNETWSWTYNEEGKLSSSQKIKNGIIQENTFYFYNKETGIPEATITKLTSDNSMILKDFKVLLR